MSQTIDERVVEMRFDNKQFEAGTKETLGSLRRLKEALKLPDSSKALEKIDDAARKISLEGISSGVEALNRRFSNLGIVGMRVIENITDGLMGKLNSAVNLVTNSIVSGGIKRAMNIENAHFQLQALLKDESKVQAVMADAMESVDGTAYAYDEAAKAASQFAASGLQSGEEMLNALKGITGVAAMTNSSFEEISMIFTTVAGNGRVMGDQLLQLSGRGLNAASTLANYFKEVRGQASMTEGTIRDMVSAGEVSFKDFSDAMTWAFGDSAKRANETFSGSMANMKSALARIGAGFISPLVEQNGELVQLFNALRIKINDVKTALVFDEQSSAVSGLVKKSDLLVETMSDYVSTGTIGLDKITEGLIGVGKSEEDLQKLNESISESYNKVKESGVATIDTLMEFKKNGINVSRSIRDYINGTLDGTVKVSRDLKETILDLTNGTKVTASSIGQLVQDGKISYDVLTNSLVNSSGVMKKSGELTTTVVKEMMSEVKKSGSVTYDTLVKFNKNGINAAKALKVYMNEVADGTKRASYSTKQAIEEMANGADITAFTIEKMVEEGKITYDIFQSAMENMYGDQRNLSKRFTDFFLDEIKKIIIGIESIDLTKPMEIFYFWAGSAKNVIKGLLSVLKPFGKSFSDVFLSFDSDRILEFSERIEELTSKLKLSDKGSKNLYDTFHGLFSIVKLLSDGIFKLIGLFIPINEPILDMGDGILGLTGSFGRLLTKTTEVIRSSKILKGAFDGLSKGSKSFINWISRLIKSFKDFGRQIYESEKVEKVINNIKKALFNFFDGSYNRIKDFGENFKDLIKFFKDLKGIDAPSIFENISESFSDFADNKTTFSIEKFGENLDFLGEKIRRLADLIMSNDGIFTFVKNAKEFAEELDRALSWDNLLNRMENIMKVFEKFFNWIKTRLLPAFSEIDFGSVVAVGEGGGLILVLLRMTKAFEKLSSSIQSVKVVSKVMDGFKGVLLSYQKNLNASALIKVAGAIAILAGALVVLSFADTKRLLGASLALSVVSSALILSLSKFMEAMNKGKGMDSAAKKFADGLSGAFKQLGKAVKIKALGSAVKDFAKSITIIAVSIIALGVMWKKDSEAFEAAIKTVGAISAVLLALGIVIPILSRFGESKKMASAGFSVLALSGSLLLVVIALNKLLNMDIPSDYKKKLKILAEIFGGFVLLILSLGAFSRLAGKNQMPAIGKTIKSLSVLLISTMISLKILFGMDLPIDYRSKLNILTKIFQSFEVLILTMSFAARVSKGQGFDAAKTIKAMSIFLIATVGSLFVLQIIKPEKLLKGATALGIVLVALGVSLAGAAKVSDEKTYKTIIAMVSAVAAISISLSVLSMIPLNKIAKATVSLGSILLALALNFKELSKIKNDKALPAVLAMIASMVSIALALYALSEQPWASLLSAGAAMSITILAFSKAFQMVGSQDWSGDILKNIASFLMMTLSIIPIADALGKLAGQPWEGLLSATLGLSATLVALSACFVVMSKTRVNLESIGAVLLGSASLLLISEAISKLAQYDTKALLSACLSLGLVLVEITALFVACSLISKLVGPAFIGLIALEGMIVEIGVFLGLLGALSKDEKTAGIREFIQEGGAVLEDIGIAIGRFIGGISSGITSHLPEIGKDLSEFMTNLEPFIRLSKMLDPSSVKNVGYLTGLVFELTAAEFINGIASLNRLSMKDLGKELSDFMISLAPFIAITKSLDESSMKACKYLADMIVTLTAAEFLTGIKRFFGLSGSLSEFADELNAFGPKIVQFSNRVKGVRAESVEGAASAAKIIAALYKELPNQGAFYEKVFGSKKTLAEFADELNAFGPKIVQFSNQVMNVKSESVAGASAAAEMMAAVANELPRQGAFYEKVFGSKKTLAEFADELKVFGPKIVQFSNRVKGITAESVEGASAAGKIMAALYSELPNQGLFDSKKTLIQFGQELVAFGPKIVQFSNQVMNVKSESVAGASAAGKMMAAIANALPNQGLFDSKKTLIQFGQELVAFGPKIVQFSNQVSGLKSGSVESASAAAEMMAALADKLPSSETLWSKIFGGGQFTLSQFGEEMVNFGESMGLVSEYMASVNTEKINAVIGNVNGLITLAKSVDKKSSNNLIDFVNQFEEVDEESIDKFVDAFSGKLPDVEKAIKDFSDSILVALTSRNLVILMPFKTLGENTVAFFIKGLNSKTESAKTAVVKFCEAITNTIKNNMSRPAFKEIGKDASLGLKEGIEEGIEEIAKAAAKAAKESIKSAKKALDERSPSKEAHLVGEYFSIGLANGIIYGTKDIASAADRAANNAFDPMQDAIDRISSYIESGDYEIAPSVKPVVDLSDVQKSSDDISRLFNTTLNISALSDISRAFNSAIDFSSLSAAKASKAVMIVSNQRSDGAMLNDSIEKLTKSLDENRRGGDVYTINGVTYRENDDVEVAVKSLINAVKVKRRV